MGRCHNCVHYFAYDICGFCSANNNIVEIKHPLFMGGSKKCECYEKIIKDKTKFKYPIKKDKSEQIMKIGDLTLKEIFEIHQNHHNCEGCPFDDSNSPDEHKNCLCHISCLTINLDLEQEIEVQKNE